MVWLRVANRNLNIHFIFWVVLPNRSVIKTWLVLFRFFKTLVIQRYKSRAWASKCLKFQLQRPQSIGIKKCKNIAKLLRNKNDIKDVLTMQRVGRIIELLRGGSSQLFLFLDGFISFSLFLCSFLSYKKLKKKKQYLLFIIDNFWKNKILNIKC